MDLKYQLEVQPSVPDSGCEREDMKESRDGEAPLCLAGTWSSRNNLTINLLLGTSVDSLSGVTLGDI